MPAEDIRHPEKQPIVFERRSSMTPLILIFITYYYFAKKKKERERETKEIGVELRPGTGVLKRERFPNTRKHSHC